jgi:hypothetical protein
MRNYIVIGLITVLMLTVSGCIGTASNNIPISISSLEAYHLADNTVGKVCGIDGCHNATHLADGVAIKFSLSDSDGIDTIADGTAVVNITLRMASGRFAANGGAIAVNGIVYSKVIHVTKADFTKNSNGDTYLNVGWIPYESIPKLSNQVYNEGQTPKANVWVFFYLPDGKVLRGNTEFNLY